MRGTAIFVRSHWPAFVLVRGSRAAALVVKSDLVRYDAAREFRFFRGVHLPGGPPRLSRAKRWMS